MSRPASDGSTTPRDAMRLSDLRLLPRRVYRLRILGMGLATLPIGTVLRELEAGPVAWAFLVFTGFVWPQLALWRASRARDPYRSELRNLMIDSAIAGLWVPLMHFNLLPSTLLVTLATVDKINTGIRGLWLWSLPGMAGGALVAGVATGFAFAPVTSFAVLVASLPMLLIHTITVSLYSYRLVRKVQSQNRQLDEMSRIDALTGLEARRTWQDHAEVLLEQRHAGGRPVTLLLVDVDRFKEINDVYGHAAGDDVLRGIAAVVRRAIGPNDHAGRYGGDELAIAACGTAVQAAALGERIRAAVAAQHWPQLSDMRCSVSIGVAEAGDADLGLREWIESADRALYRAKSAGRNRVVAAGDAVVAT
jgi:diguanylate cyclase